MDKETKALVKELSKGPVIPASISNKSLLSSGSSLFNKALSGRINGGWLKGTHNIIAGKTDSGKTVMSLLAAAEAAINPKFDDYQLIYDSPERGALMDLVKFYGPKLADRLLPAYYDAEGNPGHSEYVEEFYYRLENVLNKGPCLYILDSMDGLSSRAEKKAHIKKKAKILKGKEVTGTYTDGKAAVNSATLRQVMPLLIKTESILLMLFQSRANIGSMFGGDTHSGGNAPDFYATMQVWISRIKKITTKVGDKILQQGIVTKIQVARSRITGKQRAIEIPIYHSSGVDDLGSCVDYLISTGHWKVGNKGKIVAAELDFSGTKENLIRYVEDTDGEKDLRRVVSQVWDEIEESIQVKRKSRYV